MNISILILGIILLLIIAFIIYTIKYPLYEQKWFCTTVYWLNDHWPWWKTYIYGRAKNVEDFVRNPAEVFRETYFPFAIKNIIPISVINVRVGYRPLLPEGHEAEMRDNYATVVKNETGVDINKYTFWRVTMGDKRRWIIGNDQWTKFDIRCWNKFQTKYCNSAFFFQLTFSMKYKIIPIPWFGGCIRFNKTSYFQYGLGWGPERPEGSGPTSPYITSLCAKFRFVLFKHEQEWNPGDVYGYYEGTI